MINLSDEKPEEYNEIKWKGNLDKILYINRFAVHPFWKESDISARLMDFAEEYARKNKYTSIQLDVIDCYPADNKFFADRSYELVGSFHSAFQKLPYSCYEKNL
jgi:GNAT superfamily N-acetyltransferase